MNVVNTHSRHYDAGAEAAGALIDTLAGRDDRLWPSEAWPPMRFDRPLGVGADGGHGPIRYYVAEYEPGRRIRFVFRAPAGFEGYHELRAEGHPAGGAVLAHELRMRAHGLAVVTWPVLFRPLHDALVEDALSRAGRSLGVATDDRPWSARVRILRAILRVALGRKG